MQKQQQKQTVQQIREDVIKSKVMGLLAKLDIISTSVHERAVRDMVNSRILSTLSDLRSRTEALNETFKQSIAAKKATTKERIEILEKAVKQAESKARKNIKFLKKRHKVTGFDSDYIDKLNDDELKFMEEFARNYYDGEDPDPDYRAESNYRRYRAKKADAMSMASSKGVEVLSDMLVDDLDPEKILQIKEDLAAKNQSQKK